MQQPRSKNRAAWLTSLTLAVCAAVPAPSPADGYVGRVAGELVHTNEPAMHLPTAVTADDRGHAFVADGVNDRILHFDPSGGLATEIRTVGGETLSGPLGLKVDADGRLWIADTGNRRILVRNAAGELERTITVEQGAAKHALDITDVLPAPDGLSVWVVDNDNHRLLRVPIDPGLPHVVGGRGESLGQFVYPFMLAAGRDGEVLVSDGINGRVQVFSAEGRPLAGIGRYGVDLGQLYRPKGVACDGEGRIWIADGTLGVIQVFSSRGLVLDALRDEAGRIMRFEAPTGLAFDGQGLLYVVELRANRVLKLEISTGSRVRPPAVAPGPRPRDRQPHDCTICHLEWMEPVASGRATALMDVPEHTPELPLASRSDMCLSCHDGSVMDSRRQVWQEHGHLTGTQPPAAMQVPDILPLVDGKLDCRTCHSAHVTGGPITGGVSEAVFLRIANPEGELCMSCHADMARGPTMGTHPVGGMPWPVPDELVAAGAKRAANPRLLTCQTCHTPHGTKHEHLLVMGTESSQLCLTCHSKLRPGMWVPDHEVEHPQNPPLQTAAQKEAIHRLGTRAGPEDTLICLSCHKLHDGEAGRYMLAAPLAESQLCITCHPDRAEMFDSRHDLRLTAPEERNRRGQTPQESGPCGACHTFHQFARRPDPRPGDPTGLCTTCHQVGQCAEKAGGQPFSHPSDVHEEDLPAGHELKLYPGLNDQRRSIACLTCHDPHMVSHEDFLLRDRDTLCASCHGDLARTLMGAHDMTSHPEAVNASGRTAAEAGKCGFCHAVHGADGPVMWAATDARPADADALCLQCHQDGGLASAKPGTKYRHPTGLATAEAAGKLGGGLPLFDGHGQRAADGGVACASCHNPHADPVASPAMLRTGPTAAALCTTCHAEFAQLRDGLHDYHGKSGKWPEESQSSNDLCLSCHQAHGNDPNHQLWTSAPLTAYALEDGVCLSCHQHVEWAGHGTRRRSEIPATQPHALAAMASGEHSLPLVPTGPGKSEGGIGCKTCHDPHGSPAGPPHLLRPGGTADPGAMCLACHQEIEFIGTSLHNTAAMKEFLDRQDPSSPVKMVQCGPCHAVHAPADAPVPLTTRPLPPGTEALSADMQRCVVCHPPGLTPRGERVFQHFPDQLRNVTAPGTPGFMPLINQHGLISDEGRISCVTCHMPHGRPPGMGFPDVKPTEVTQDQLRSMMPMLRPYVAPNLCSSCHGFDGLMNYLYYHYPEKRTDEAK